MAFLEFAIKAGYVLDPWKTLVSLKIFLRPWKVAKLFIVELLITLNIQESKLNNVIKQNNV